MEATQGSDIGGAAQKIKEGAVELKSAVMDAGAEKFEAVCKSTDALIRANPYKSVLIAFGAGAAIGALIGVLARR